MGQPNFMIQVLVVDDDAMVKSIIHEYLINIGFKSITVAKNSEHALRIIQDPKNHIDLIISDWEMPEVSGLTLLKAVRNNPIRVKTPFVMVTSQRSMERFKITQAMQYQVSCYMLKPFRQENLRNKLWEILGWGDAAPAAKKSG
jgi:two-component system, chemotaxis family, chemotaxis protein CheY